MWNISQPKNVANILIVIVANFSTIYMLNIYIINVEYFSTKQCGEYLNCNCGEFLNHMTRYQKHRVTRIKLYANISIKIMLYNNWLNFFSNVILLRFA